MKILFVVNEVPFPPDNGVRIVSHHAMRLMREAGHELALAVLTEEVDDPSGRFQQAAAGCGQDLAFWMRLPRRNRFAVQALAALRRVPYFVERYRSTEFRRLLAMLIERFRPDVVHFDIITLAQYGAVAPRGVGTVASINDSHALAMRNALSGGRYTGFEQSYRKWQFRQVCRYEGRCYPRFDAVHLMSEVDAAYLRRLNASIKTVVIPNGVDAALFSIAAETSRRHDVIFVAKLVGDNLVALQSFLEHSWRLVHAACPELTLRVVGRIGAEARSLAGQADRWPNVVFEGYVDELADAYRTCAVAIAPIDKDCGVINKVLEAMAAGLAVIGFARTFSGVGGAVPGKHCVVVSNYAGFASAIIELTRDEARLRQIQRAAHEFAANHFAWATRGALYEQMYRACAHSASARGAARRNGYAGRTSSAL